MRKASAQGEMKMKSRKRSKVAVATSEDAMNVVSQSSLIEERISRQKLLRAFDRWSEKHNAIRAAIEGGAKVEQGIYRADVAPEKCVSPILDLPFTLTRLRIS
jgi:hypothetical protein